MVSDDCSFAPAQSREIVDYGCKASQNYKETAKVNSKVVSYSASDTLVGKNMNLHCVDVSCHTSADKDCVGTR